MTCRVRTQKTPLWFAGTSGKGQGSRDKDPPGFWGGDLSPGMSPLTWVAFVLTEAGNQQVGDGKP